MSRVSRSTRIDKNRFAKTYPFLHRVPSYTYINEPQISYEVGEICFSSNSTIVYTFETPYIYPPSVVITSKNDDVAVWISSITEEYVEFQASVPTNSCVSFHIVNIGP